MTITVLDANENPVVLNRPNANGRQNAAGSRPVAISTEDLAAINALGTLLGTGNASLASILAALTGGLSISASALPSGGSTSALQTAGNAILTSILTALGAQATAALQTSGNAVLSDILARLNDPLGVTQDGAFDVNITNASVLAEFDPLTFPGYKPGTNVPVVDATANFVFTSASGTSTGSAIAALGADANRRAFQFQNASDTDFTVNFDGTASASAGFLVAPGKLIEFYGPACPKGAVSVFCGASAKRYVLRTA